MRKEKKHLQKCEQMGMCIILSNHTVQVSWVLDQRAIMLSNRAANCKITLYHSCSLTDLSKFHHSTLLFLPESVPYDSAVDDFYSCMEKCAKVDGVEWYAAYEGGGWGGGLFCVKNEIV